MNLLIASIWLSALTDNNDSDNDLPLINSLNRSSHTSFKFNSDSVLPFLYSLNSTNTQLHRFTKSSANLTKLFFNALGDHDDPQTLLVLTSFDLIDSAPAFGLIQGAVPPHICPCDNQHIPIFTLRNV